MKKISKTADFHFKQGSADILLLGLEFDMTLS